MAGAVCEGSGPWKQLWLARRKLLQEADEAGTSRKKVAQNKAFGGPDVGHVGAEMRCVTFFSNLEIFRFFEKTPK